MQSVLAECYPVAARDLNLAFFVQSEPPALNSELSASFFIMH